MTGKHDYSFRNRDYTAVPPLSPTPNACGDKGCRIDEEWEIVVRRTDSRLTRYFSEDLCRFFSDAFGVSLHIRRVTYIRAFFDSSEKAIILAEEKDAPDFPVASDMAVTFPSPK